MLDSFFYVSDTSSASFDSYGDRLKLTIDVPETVQKSLPLKVSAKFTLDGNPIPVVSTPLDDDTEKVIQDPGAVPYGAAFAALAVTFDVAGDIDEINTRAMAPVASGTVTASDSDATKQVREYMIKVVGFMRPRQEDHGPGKFDRAHRIARARVQVIDDGATGPTDNDDVWIANRIRPVGQYYEQSQLARVSLTQIGDFSEDFNLPGIRGSVIGLSLSRRGVDIDRESGNVFVVHTPGDPSRRQQLHSINSEGRSVQIPVPFQYIHDFAVFGQNGNRLLWVSGGDNPRSRGLALLRVGDPTPIRSLPRNSTTDLSIDPVTGGVWAASKFLGAPSVNHTMTLFRPNGNDIQVPHLRDLLPPQSQSDRMMLPHGLNDGGAVVYCLFKRTARVVRIDDMGEIIAFSETPLSSLVEMGVNRVTGEVSATVTNPLTKRNELILLDAGFNVVEKYESNDPVFNGGFEALYSTDISATPNGTRIWVTGYRRVPDPITGELVRRGVIGYLDEKLRFTEVPDLFVNDQALVRSF